MKKYIYFTVLFLSSCKIFEIHSQRQHEKYLREINASIHTTTCNFENAKRIADSLFVYRLKFDMKEHYEKFSENDTSYTFQLFHNQIESKDPKVLIIVNGGGGEITISKKDCKVINTIMGQ